MNKIRSTVLVAATSLAVLAPTQAFADITRHKDATSDMVRISEDEESEEVTPAPERRDGDIGAIDASHAKRKVKVSVRYRELTRDTDFTAPYFSFRTNEGKSRFLIVSARESGSKADATLFNNQGKRIRCNVAATFDTTRKQVTVAVPRGCLSSPRWVRVGAAVISLDEPDVFLDDAYINGTVREDIALGPKIRR